MRDAGKALHRSPDIRWLDDSLPALEKVLRSKLTFDLIWLSAVWMHVPTERPRPGVPQTGLGDESRRQHDADPPPGSAACRTPDGAGHRRRCGSAGPAARPANGSQRACSGRLWAGRDRVGGHLAPAPGRWHRRPSAAPARGAQRPQVVNLQARPAADGDPDRGRRRRPGAARAGRALRGPAARPGGAVLGPLLPAAHREEPAPAPGRQCPAGLRQGGL